MIKYLGSKRRLVPQIVALARAIPGVERVLDLFSGTTRVAQGLKEAGFAVTANDLASYSEVLARAYIEVDATGATGPAVDLSRVASLLESLNGRPGVPGYITRTFCEEARYFQPMNGARIDAIRAGITELARTPAEEALLLTSLLEAADRVDSTTGVQMAYLKQWSARSYRPLELRMPRLIPGTGVAVRRDASAWIGAAPRFDLVYLDPPYNQHSYYSNYHIWETVVRGDSPESYGIARKRTDCREHRSVFNSRRGAWEAFRAIVQGLPARHAIVSFSDEGFFSREAIETLLTDRFGEVACLAVDSRRYVGAQIGIHNPKGERVGAVSHLRNQELLFLAGPDATAAMHEATAVAEVAV